MKKIAIIHYTFLPVVAGVELFIRDHANLFAQKGYDIKIISGVGEKFNPKIKVEVLPELNPAEPKNLALRKIIETGKIPIGFEKQVKIIEEKLKKSIAGIDICIIHQALTMHFNLALTCAMFEIIKTNEKIKFINWAHDATFLDKNYLQKFSGFKKIYPWSLLCQKWENVKYVAISNARQKLLSELFKVSKNEIAIVPNGIDLPSFWQFDKQTKDLFYQEKLYECDLVGILPMRVVRRKNIEKAIEIIAEMKKIIPNIKYIITGGLDFQNPDIGEYFQILKSLRKKLGLEKNVIFLSEYKINGKKINLKDLKINELYLFADFLLVPSKIEGFGMPLIEAGAMKTPIICSKINVFEEIGKNDVLYFDLEENPETIAKNAIDFLKKCGNNEIFRRVVKNYNLENIYQNKIEPLLKC